MALMFNFTVRQAYTKESDAIMYYTVRAIYYTGVDKKASR